MAGKALDAEARHVGPSPVDSCDAKTDSGSLAPVPAPASSQPPSLPCPTKPEAPTPAARPAPAASQPPSLLCPTTPTPSNVADIDLVADILVRYGRRRLRQLLADRTTRRNVIWATAERPGPDDEILLADITGPCAGAIRPRVAKAAAQRASRTKAKAEVYTPSWVCNMMINDLDETFFGRRDAFNVESEDGRSWSVSQRNVSFDGTPGTWQDYVSLPMLEITCGEAPFVCSRYDATTGDMIPVPERFGILDRKLRVVTENAATEGEWLFWAKRALRSTYAYEYQGDSLLIARINVFLTMAEWTRFRWSRELSPDEASCFAHTVSWNVWQMDGMTGCVPLTGCHPAEQGEQLSLFDVDDGADMTHAGVPCMICDWSNSEKKVPFISLTGRL